MVERIERLEEMPRDKSFEEYQRKLKDLRECAIRNIGLSTEEMEQVFRSCQKIIQIRKRRSRNVESNLKERIYTATKQLIKYSLLLILSTLIIYVILNVHQPTSSIVLRNVQGLIYPGLKVWRFLSVPFVKAFPSLTSKHSPYFLFKFEY